MEHGTVFYTYLEVMRMVLRRLCGVVGAESCFRAFAIFHCARLPKPSILGEPSHNR